MSESRGVSFIYDRGRGFKTNNAAVITVHLLNVCGVNSTDDYTKDSGFIPAGGSNVNNACVHGTVKPHE